jgi:S1-C subfamily serine protease
MDTDSRQVWQMDPEEMIWAEQNADAILRDLSLSVAADERGNVKGLRVAGIQDGSIAMLRGVEEGDVVRSVNGQPLQSPDDLRRMQEQSKGKRQNSMTMVIERAGRSVQIEYLPLKGDSGPPR